MTAFADKLAAHKAGQTAASTDYKRSVWRLMIACGGASPIENPDRWAAGEIASQYSATVETDRARTIEYLAKIADGLVDYDASGDPAEGHGPIFDDTFADNAESFPYLAGVLRFTDGTWTWWAVKVGGRNADFGAVVRAITALDLSDAEAIEHLEDRLTRPEAAGGGFRYDCVLPEL
jgi:hypothetical protein